MRNLHTEKCGPERDWQNGKRHPGQIIYSPNSGRNWEEMLSWGRSRNGQMTKPKLDNAGRLRGIYLIDLEDKEFKETIRNARKKLETLMALAMPCKTSKTCKHGEIRSKTDDFKSKFACILGASESTRLRMEEPLPNYHEDQIARKGDNSLQHYNFCSQIYSYASSNEDTRSESSSGQGMGKIGENFGVGPGKSQKQIRGDRWSKDVGRYSSFWLTDGHLSFEKCWIGGKAPQIQGSSSSPRWYCRRQLWILCSIHWTRIISVSNDCSKSHGYHLQTAGLRRTSSWRSTCLYPGKNGKCFKTTGKSWIGMSRYLDSSTTTQMAKIMVQYGRSSRSSWKKSVPSSFGRTGMEKAIWENPIAARLGEGFQLGMFVRTPWKRVILICVCGWHIIGWKETKSWSDVESTKQRSWFGRTNIFPWSCVLGMYSKTMWNEQRCCWQLQNHVWIQNFCRSNWKITISSKYSYFFMVLWHGWSCKEMRGAILWAGEQDDSTTLQSINSMHWRPSIQRRRIEICWRIVKYMLSNCSEMLKFGKNWTTWYSMVSEQTCTFDHKMDQSLWQTPESIDIIHPSYVWIQTILSCG